MRIKGIAVDVLVVSVVSNTIRIHGIALAFFHAVQAGLVAVFGIVASTMDVVDALVLDVLSAFFLVGIGNVRAVDFFSFLLAFGALAFRTLAFGTLAFRTLTFGALAFRTLTFRTLAFGALAFRTLAFGALAFRLAFNFYTSFRIRANALAFGALAFRTLAFRTLTFGTLTFGAFFFALDNIAFSIAAEFNVSAIHFNPPPGFRSLVVDPLRNGATSGVERVALAFLHVLEAFAVAVLVIILRAVFERDATSGDNLVGAFDWFRNRSSFNARSFHPPPSFGSLVVDPLRNRATERIEGIASASLHVFEATVVAVLIIILCAVHECNATLFGPRSFLSSCKRCEHRHSHR